MHLLARGIALALALITLPGSAIAQPPPAAGPDNGPAPAPREELPLFVTGEHWQRWGERERVFFVKGFVEAYHSQGRPYVPRPDIQTIADVDHVVSVFYARHPEARRMEVNVLIETLLGSALDLDSLAHLSRLGAGIREEAAPTPSPTPASSAPDY